MRVVLLALLVNKNLLKVDRLAALVPLQVAPHARLRHVGCLTHIVLLSMLVTFNYQLDLHCRCTLHLSFRCCSVEARPCSIKTALIRLEIFEHISIGSGRNQEAVIPRAA